MAQIPPRNVSVLEAARHIGVSIWTIRKRCDAGLIESTYEGSRRLVNFESLNAYADSLPTARPEETA